MTGPERVPELTAAVVVGVLADPTRVQVLGAVALGARGAAEVAERAGLPTRTAAQALAKLVAVGLVDPGGGVRRDALRALAVSGPTPGAQDGPDELRAFLRDGRVTGFPAQPGRRLRLLEHVVMAFELDRDYREPEVNAVLDAQLDGPDHATLRRYLVDARLLLRAHGVYRRG